MSHPSFIRRIQANLEHWLAAVLAIEDYDFAALDPEWANLLQSIHFGLQYEATRPAAAELWKAMIGFVEARGRLGPWQKVTERVLEILDELPPEQMPRIANEGAFFYIRLIQLDLAESLHQKALVQARILGDDFERGLAHMGIGHLFFLQHHYDEAISEIHMALEILNGIERAAIRTAGGYGVLGEIFQVRGEYPASEKHLKKACRIYLKHGHRRKAAAMLQALGTTQHRAEKSREGIASIQEALRLIDPDAGPDTWAHLYLHLGTIYFELGDFQLAKTTFQQIDQRALEEYGTLENLAWTNNNLGNVALKEKDWALAREHLAYAAGLLRQLKAEVGLGNTLGDLAEAKLNLGDRTEAIAHMDEAIILLRKYPENAWARKRLKAILAQREAARG